MWVKNTADKLFVISPEICRCKIPTASRNKSAKRDKILCGGFQKVLRIKKNHTGRERAANAPYLAFAGAAPGCIRLSVSN